MLALDPYYEMFPVSRQRPWPYWYGLGQVIPVAQEAITPPDRTKIESTCPTAVSIGVCSSPAALRALALEDATKVACCFFNAFKVNDVAAARTALTLHDATKQAQLLGTMLQAFPESADFIERVQTKDEAVVLSTCAKIAIGAVVLGAVGVATIALARRVR